MRHFVMGLVFLAGAAATAQPWQWEQYAGDYYNPTGFADPPAFGYPTPFVAELGDFNGDARDEYICLEGSNQVTAAVRVPGELRWLTSTFTQQLTNGSPCRGLLAIHLDWDGCEELIVFCDTVLAWDVVSTNPWTFAPFLPFPNFLIFPPEASKVVFGDFNGSGTYQAAALDMALEDPAIRFYHTTGAAWVYDSLWTVPFAFSLCAGDFDHDDDVDLATVQSVVDWWPMTTFLENTGSGHSVMRFSDLPVPLSGDLDGDFQWESLCLFHDSPGYVLVETQADSANFVTVAQESLLARVPGPVLGNFRTADGIRVATVYSFWNDFPTYIPSFRCYVRQADRWAAFNNGFQRTPGFELRGGNMEDVDGDGKRDILAVVATNFPLTYWSIWKNIGTALADSFSRDSTVFFRTFAARTDTLFLFPQLGDVNGDGRAELATLAVPFGSSGGQVQVYEIVGDYRDTTFVFRPEWGLAVNDCRRLAMGDLDDDGHAELCVRIGVESAWRTYFFRHGQWERYDVLPPVTADSISFADADNDGDLDLFTPNDVCLSLSPEAVDRDFILHPSSLALSCFPNPFNARTEIRFVLPQAARVELALFDILGRRVATLANGVLTAGEHSVPFDGSNWGSGIYFARLSASHRQTALKLMLIR
jgi:hypothetical protein